MGSGSRDADPVAASRRALVPLRVSQLPIKRWVALLAVAVVVAWIFHAATRKPPAAKFAPGTREFLTNALRVLQEDEARMAQKYWGPELASQKHGAVFEQLWDSLNQATNKWEALKKFPIPKIIWAERTPHREVAHGVRIFDPSANKISITKNEFHSLLNETNWRLAKCEFRHIAFSPKGHSTFYFSAHLENADERAILEGDLIVNWDGLNLREIDASNLQLRTRKGLLPFHPILDQEVAPPYGSYFIDPLIVRGTNVILAARNEIYRAPSWQPTRLCDEDIGLIFTALLGDFNGDGVDDFLTAKFDGLFLHEGSDGKFPSAGRLVWTAKPRLKYAQVMTSGDIDSDGDLDVFLGQYKLPYEKGNMPFPYFNANDGYPSFLLINDGKGNFTDVTDARGLAPKSHRRVYSSSLVDLDRDKDLDLMIVSDFGGLDAFENNGKGTFSDATKKWGLETQAFGMAHSFGDFNRDGLMDILLIGMTSPVVDRLEGMGLMRPYEVADAGKRKPLAHGNRLFFGFPNGVYAERAISSQIARTGWSWGSTATDFDGDGYPDIYIANGHDTKQSVRDYETEFWLHDIYVGNSQENYLAEAYFKEKETRMRGGGWSYGGYEKNRLFLNQAGTNFVEVGFLFGVALEADSRNVVAKDLNGDGAPELIVITYEVYPKVRQTLKIFENRLKVNNLQVRRPFKVTGDSYRSQTD